MYNIRVNSVCCWSHCCRMKRIEVNAQETVPPKEVWPLMWINQSKQKRWENREKVHRHTQDKTTITNEKCSSAYMQNSLPAVVWLFMNWAHNWKAIKPGWHVTWLLLSCRSFSKVGELSRVQSKCGGVGRIANSSLVHRATQQQHATVVSMKEDSTCKTPSKSLQLSDTIATKHKDCVWISSITPMDQEPVMMIVQKTIFCSIEACD